MSRYVYQYINSANNNPPPLSNWRLVVLDVNEDAKMLSDSKIVFESPCCETREECDGYRKEFDSYA